MVKEMRFESDPFLLRRHKDAFLKAALSFALLGLAFRLFFADSFDFSSPAKASPALPDLITHSPENPLPTHQNPIMEDVPANQIQTAQNDSKAKCDIFVGEWVPDPKGPAYTNETCHGIETHQNCMRNGRQDSGYLYWRWSPRDCDLPRFDPRNFLELMRNKSWAFIGDSIQRNHVQSLICTLSQVEEAVEIYHDEEYRSKKWIFPSYNFTLSVVWAPFIAKAAIFEDNNGFSSSAIQLHLDELDKDWTSQFKDLDYVVIAAGKWFLKNAIYYENNTATACHNCVGKNLTDVGFEHAYRKTFALVLNFLANSDHKALVILRTTTPDHFENGEWFSGGTCNRTVPFKEGQVDLKDEEVVMRNIEIEEYDKVVASGKGRFLKLLDTTRLSLLRPDGHPGPYRIFQPFSKNKNEKVQNDCLHWCLPGPIDSWNDLMMEMLIRDGEFR